MENTGTKIFLCGAIISIILGIISAAHLLWALGDKIYREGLILKGTVFFYLVIIVFILTILFGLPYLLKKKRKI